MITTPGTYRSFKFPFVADPDYPPDIYSNASSNGNTTTTTVYASWNGATEVASWTLHKTDITSKRALQLNSVARSGFETTIKYDGYAQYVFVEAKDKNGKSLGKSKPIETVPSKDISSAAVAEELLWLSGAPDADPDVPSRKDDLISNPMATFIVGIFCGGMIFAAAFFVIRRRGWWRSRGGEQAYERVSAGNAADYDETKLDDLSPKRSYRDGENDGVFRVPDEDSDRDDGP